MLVGWWFSGREASIKSRNKKVKTSLCDVKCCRRRGWCSSVWMCVLLSLDIERISSFIVIPSSNRINFGLSLFFLPRRSQIGRKITFDFIFVRNPINISLCVKPIRRDAFFFLFWKKSRSRQHPVSGLLSCLLELPLFCLYDKSEEISISHITHKHIYQPLRSGRIWHKVKFLNGV